MNNDFECVYCHDTGRVDRNCPECLGAGCDAAFCNHVGYFQVACPDCDKEKNRIDVFTYTDNRGGNHTIETD